MYTNLQLDGVEGGHILQQKLLHQHYALDPTDMPEQANLLFLHTGKCARRADTNVEIPNITIKDEVG
ncbi:hypothetical protein P3L10_014249 [Capsicum annuum]